jgi:hypothetical protein
MRAKSCEQTVDVELDRTTVDRLRERAKVDSTKTIDDTVSELLDETSVSITLEEFIDRIVADGDVAQIAVYKTTTDPLDFIVHSGSGLDGDLFGEVDYVEVDGELHRFRLDVTGFGPQVGGRVTIYTSELLQDINGDVVEGGVGNLEEWLDYRHEEIRSTNQS